MLFSIEELKALCNKIEDEKEALSVEKPDHDLYMIHASYATLIGRLYEIAAKQKEAK